MENATKALIMAASVLIGVLILSLAVYLFNDFGQTAAEINYQNTATQLSQFNSRFVGLIGKELTIHDVVTIAGYVQENNQYYDGIPEYQIDIRLNSAIVDLTDKEALLTNPTYSNATIMVNDIDYHSENGRVSKVAFQTY